MTALGLGLGSRYALLLLPLLACATRDVPTRHPRSSALASDAAAGAPLLVTRALEDDPSFTADGNMTKQATRTAVPSATPHSHQHRGHAHGH